MIRIALAVLLAASLGRGIQAQAGGCAGLVDEAFRVAGVNDQIAALPTQLSQSTAAAGQSGLSPADLQRMLGILKSAFLPSRVGRGMKQYFQASCDEQMLKTVIAGLSDPQGAKMRRLESFTLTPQGDRQMRAYAEALVAQPPDRTRLALIKKMDASLGATSFAVDLTIASMRGMGAGAGSQLDAGLEASLRAQIYHNLLNCTLVNLLFTYREVSDSELEAYIELYETPAFARFHETYKAAFLAVVETLAADAGSALKRAFGAPPNLR